MKFIAIILTLLVSCGDLGEPTKFADIATVENFETSSDPYTKLATKYEKLSLNCFLERKITENNELLLDDSHLITWNLLENDAGQPRYTRFNNVEKNFDHKVEFKSNLLNGKSLAYNSLINIQFDKKLEFLNTILSNPELPSMEVQRMANLHFTYSQTSNLVITDRLGSSYNVDSLVPELSFSVNEVFETLLESETRQMAYQPIGDGIGIEILDTCKLDALVYPEFEDDITTPIK